MKFKWTSKALIPLLIVLLGLIFLFVFIDVRLNPMNHYPYAHSETPVEEALNFIYTKENIISIVSGFVFAGFAIILALDLLFRPKSSHIAVTLIGTVLVLAHSIVRIVWTANNLSTFTRSIASMALYIVGALAIAGSLFCFVKKSLDGDADLLYWVMFGIGLVATFFGAMSRFSLLDAFGATHNPVFWGGYASTRFALLTFAALAITNSKSDYDPNPIQLDEFGNPIIEKK